MARLRRANIVRMTYLSTYLALMTHILSSCESCYGQAARLTELMNLVNELLEVCNENGFSCGNEFPHSIYHRRQDVLTSRSQARGDSTNNYLPQTRGIVGWCACREVATVDC